MLWSDGEREVAYRPAALAGVELHGRVDRLDRLGAAAAGDGAFQLLDYKTTAAHKLERRLRQRYEDTQLAFYAALLALAEGEAGAPPALRAAYVALDGSGEVRECEHPEVVESAQALVAGLAHDYERLRAGAPLLALGEGALCEHCDARGLCRRDHWAALA